MRKLTFAAVVLVALIATSYAVANGIEGAKSAKAVVGTFAATGTSTSSRTCTTTDGKTIVVTDGKYTGLAAGDPDLTGPITLRARSVVNTTDNVGTVDGRFTIDLAAGKNTEANYSAVYDHGAIAGLATGKAHESNGKLVANLSATFSATSGFTGGKLGGGTSGGYPVFRALYEVGVTTIIAMHIDEADLLRLRADEQPHWNLVISGHVPSDSIGINRLIWELEDGGLECTRCSGVIKAER